LSNFCLLTNDVETTSIWLNTLRPETGFKVFREGMPRLLEIYEQYNIKSTFFFTGNIARLIPDVVKMVIPYGHEVGSHGLSHEKQDGFDILSYNEQLFHLKESKKILEDISGQKVISFRAPALRVNHNTARGLIDAEYKIDSSVASQRFDMFLSYGGIRKLQWFFTPRLPYYTSPDNLLSKGNGPIVEIPISATLFPYIGTTMRIFPSLTKLQRNLLNAENKVNGNPIVFDIHPNELIDESDEARIINRRSNNNFSYFFKDWLRSQLKAKNLGPNALLLYESQIQFFKNRKYSFCTLKDYCERKGFTL